MEKYINRPITNKAVRKRESAGARRQYATLPSAGAQVVVSRETTTKQPNYSSLSTQRSETQDSPKPTTPEYQWSTKNSIQQRASDLFPSRMFHFLNYYF